MIRSALRPFAVADSGLTTLVVKVYRLPARRCRQRCGKRALSSDARRPEVRPKAAPDRDAGRTAGRAKWTFPERRARNFGRPIAYLYHAADTSISSQRLTRAPIVGHSDIVSAVIAVLLLAQIKRLSPEAHEGHPRAA